MNRAPWISTLFLLLFFSLACTGQDFPMLRYTMEDGLPSNTVYEIYRDSKGTLWFATNKGIARYNGIKFEVFTTFSGLPDNEIFFFQEDKLGRLWLATFNGELCYFKDDSFHTAKNTPFLKKQLRLSFITQIESEKDSSVTISFYEEGTFVNVKDNKCRPIYLDPNYNNEKIYPVVKHVTKLSPKVYKLTCVDRVLYVTANGKIINSIPSDVGKNLFLFGQNKRFIVTHDSIYTVDGTPLKKLTDSRVQSNLENNAGLVHRVYFDNANTLIASEDGLSVNDSLIFKTQKISSITQDNRGNYWVSSLQHGVFYLNKSFLNQRVINNVYSEKLNFISARAGHLFYATASNDLYHLENGVPRCLFNYSKYRKKFDHFFDPGYLIDSSFRYYNLYNEDHIFIDNLLSPQPRVTRYPSTLATPGIKNMFLVDKSIYIQDIKTITRIDFIQSGLTGQVSESYHPLIDAYAPLRIFSSAQAPDNAIWYSTINNVFRLKDGKTKAQRQFKNISFRSFDFCGTYLVGYTHGNKLVVCNIIGDSIIINDVPGQDCIWDRIYKLDANHMLISTNNLYRVVTLYPSDGKPVYSVETVENPFVPLYVEAISSDGVTCYFFKGGSITAVDVKTLLVKPDPPELFFTSLKTGKAAFPISDNMKMSFFSSKSMTISFATVSFGGRNVSYQYSFAKAGRDNWRNITGNDINILNPGYGNYVIKVRAKTISSAYSKPIVFMMHITRPFWATWWFITLSALLVVLAVRAGVLKLIATSLAKKEKQHQREVKFMKSEYKALNALMNPHFIFNTLNNVQSLFNNNDRLAANEYLRVFSDLIRQNMHNVSKELIPLQKEMDLVDNYLRLEKLRFEDKLNYSVDIDNGFDLSDIMVPPLLIQPLVENSIKHGILPLTDGNGYINIKISERFGVLYIEVKDNGVGLTGASANHDDSHESFGLENIKKRIEQLSIIQNKKITFDLGERINGDGSRWTVVTISMNINS
ncbi:MAG: histidine kinase [Bacteroidota bacterium]